MTSSRCEIERDDLCRSRGGRTGNADDAPPRFSSGLWNDYRMSLESHPEWNKPIVCISSNQGYFDFSNEVGKARMLALGRATARAIEKSGKRAVLLASCSLSHRHFTKEPDTPEDMKHEHVYHNGQYLWDMKILNLIKEGKCQELLDIMPDFIEQAMVETKDGSLTWLMGALGIPDYPGDVHSHGSVIGQEMLWWNGIRHGKKGCTMAAQLSV